MNKIAMFKEHIEKTAGKIKFKDLKKNQVPLTPEERKEVIDRKATWGGTNLAVWKSVDKDGETTFVTHTHRAFNTAPTLKGAIGRFHNFIKSTASENIDDSIEKIAREQILYHASPVQDIKKFRHSEDTSGNNKGKVIFAAKDPGFAAAFGTRWHDAIARLNVETKNTKVPTEDNYVGSTLKYTDKVNVDAPCSMYRLKGDFKPLRYADDLEQITNNNVEIISEEKFNSFKDMAKAYNLNLREVSEGHILNKLKDKKSSNFEKVAGEKIQELEDAFSDPIEKKVAYMIATSHEYKKPNINAALSFVKNYKWELSKEKVKNLQGIEKPVNEEKVADMAKNMKHVEPFIVVNQLHGIRPQTPGKKILIDGHHRKKACEAQGREEVPVYKGTYTGKAELPKSELREKTAEEEKNESYGKIIGTGVGGAVLGLGANVGSTIGYMKNSKNNVTSEGHVRRSMNETADRHNLDKYHHTFTYDLLDSSATDINKAKKTYNRVEPFLTEKDKGQLQKTIGKGDGHLVRTIPNEATALHELGHVKQFGNKVWQHAPSSTKLPLLAVSPLMSSHVRNSIRKLDNGKNHVNDSMDFVENHPEAIIAGTQLPRLAKELDANRFATSELIRKHGLKKGVTMAKQLAHAQGTYLSAAAIPVALGGMAFRLWNKKKDTEKNAYEVIDDAFEKIAFDKTKTYAVDFDGTIVENKFPKIGAINENMVSFMKKVKAEGGKVLIWTCRSGKYLHEMKKFLKENDIPFDAINTNPEKDFGSPKIYADYYVDDRAINIKEITKNAYEIIDEAFEKIAAQKQSKIDAHLNKIRRSGTRQTMLNITYTDKKGERTGRNVEPYKLEGDSFWGYDPYKDGIRRFKVSQINNVKMTNVKFEPRWPIETDSTGQQHLTDIIKK